MEAQFILESTMRAVIRIADNQGIEITPAKKQSIITLMQSTFKERVSAILTEVQKDAKDADFLGQGYKNGRIPAMSMHAGKISLQHGIVMYAKYLVENAN